MPRSPAPRLTPSPINLLEDPALPEQYYPVLLMLGIAIVMAVAILGLSQLLGGRPAGASRGPRWSRASPCSTAPTSGSRSPSSSIAIDFIVFDLEAAFLYPWALIMREGGWPLFWAVMVFFFLILVGYAYVWLKGGLELGPRASRPATVWRSRRDRGPRSPDAASPASLPRPAPSSTSCASATPPPRRCCCRPSTSPSAWRRLAAGRGDRRPSRPSSTCPVQGLRRRHLLRPLPPEAGRPAPHPRLHQPVLPAPRLRGDHGDPAQELGVGEERSPRTAAARTSTSSAWARATPRP